MTLLHYEPANEGRPCKKKQIKTLDLDISSIYKNIYTYRCLHDACASFTYCDGQKR